MSGETNYEYAPFSEVTTQVRSGGVTAYDFSALNPWRFSSEYADDALACDYYNYRHYEPVTGRWLSKDSLIYSNNDLSILEQSLYLFVNNNSLSKIDVGGFFPSGENDGWGEGDRTRGNCWRYACNDKNRFGEDPFVNPPSNIEECTFSRLDYTCESIKNGLKDKYGIDSVNNGENCPKCHYRVLLVLRIETRCGPFAVGNMVLMPDYHWYREDTNKDCEPTGTWSHKPGKAPVITGVTDPSADAKKRVYEIVCDFYFCFPCKSGGASIDVDR